MNAQPTSIGGATVICFTRIDQRHQATGKCQPILGGPLQSPACGLAVCRYDQSDGYTLFGCDDSWNAITDTWHATLEDAKQQAEFECAGVSKTWQAPEKETRH